MADAASQAAHLYESLRVLGDPDLPPWLDRYPGEAIGQKETRFRLTVPDREFNVPHADLKLLRKIADASNGGFYGHEDLGEVLQEILDKKLATEIRREYHDDIWNSYPMLALFLVPLLLEWIIRRRKGRV